VHEVGSLLDVLGELAPVWARWIGLWWGWQPGQRAAAPPAAAMVSTWWPSAVSSRAASTTCAPAAAKPAATAAPMPRLAPVTSATLPESVRGRIAVMPCPRRPRCR
jgi:hypothetical protein